MCFNMPPYGGPITNDPKSGHSELAVTYNETHEEVIPMFYIFLGENCCTCDANFYSKKL